MTGQIPPSSPSGLPQAIDLQPGDAVPVNRHLSLLFDGDRVTYFAFTLPFASHPVDDFRSRNRCLAHCALHKLATLADLARAFDISPRTVMRARQRLQRQGEAGFDRVHKKRRRHGIEDLEILQQAARMLADGTSLRVQSQIISAVGPCFFSNCSDAQTAGNPNNQRIRSPWIGKLRLRIRQGRIPAGTRLALRAPAGYARGGPRVRPAGPWSAQPCKFDMPQT